MTLIIPNQKFTHGKTIYEAGRKYDVSEDVAVKMVKEGKGKTLKGDMPKEARPISVRVPKVTHRDPVIEAE